MIRVSRQNLRADIARARAVAAQGNTCLFTGNPRQLDRLRKALRDDSDLRVFLGDDERGATVLCVEPADEDAGSLLVERPAS